MLIHCDVFQTCISGVPPVSPVVLPVSVPYNPASAASGAAPSLYIPQGVQPIPQPTGNTPSPTTSTPTSTGTPVPQVVVSSSRSDTQNSAPSSGSQSPSVFTSAEPVAAAGQGTGISGETAAENKCNDERDDIRVEPYVDFTDFYRQVAEYGENYVYGWDRESTETPG